MRGSLIAYKLRLTALQSVGFVRLFMGGPFGWQYVYVIHYTLLKGNTLKRTSTQLRR
jgi:hypothetical protein